MKKLLLILISMMCLTSCYVSEVAYTRPYYRPYYYGPYYKPYYYRPYYSPIIIKELPPNRKQHGAR